MNPPEALDLPAQSREDIAAARRQLLAAARRRIDACLPRLAPDVLGGEEELAELRRIATAGRGALIRVILHDPAAALRDGHRLIALAQRLPSLLEIRMPVEEADLAYASGYLLNDTGGYLFLPEAERPRGRAALCDRAAQAPLRQHFDAAWLRAVRASMLQPLDL
ncbi:hypothetical protein [Fulvimonas soli]|jgi:hypothetical protein|uniref:DUF7931 domain-containing protein n=1 Tax=Fulvimonas soli TaxID=155197 RepID=A0A316IBM5_9GAMM|nr:hypothetical protein [Fulvimonas soli]PWK89912.1 hypothetical protein C7456_104270 [Fulvimonas soli]TNY26235.1 hypothetical protein BV497_09830 [Fulvimonas soli]